MAGKGGHENDRVTAYRQALMERPWAHDFYQVMRRIEGLHPGLPRLGEARRPADEAVRLGEQPDLAFAPATISHAEVGRDGRLRLLVRFLGLWGPQGPLPMHLTELARERQRSYGDVTLVRFADVFHHRVLLLFFRAWRQAQPTASRDRPAADRYRTYVGALFGQGSPAWFARAAINDDSKRFFVGHLHRGARNADGLADILTSYFRVPVRVQAFAPRWMHLPPSQRFALGRGGAATTLGQGVVVGARVLDAQHHFCLHLGPMPLAEYERFLPRGGWHDKLRDWVREYVGEEFDVSAIAAVTPGDVPGVALGKAGRLGWTSWLGRWRSKDAAAGARLALSQAAT